MSRAKASFKPIAIRAGDKPIVLYVTRNKARKIREALEQGEEFHFYMTEREIETTKKFRDQNESEDDDEHEGGFWGALASVGLPIIGDLIGKLFNKGKGGGRIFLSNAGGRLDLGWSKTVPTYSAYLKP